MLKELFELIRLLFSSNPKDIEEMKVKNMKHFPFKGYKAMAWCGTIIHREGASKVNDITINHETIHLMQAKMCGSWVKYYWRYFIDWLKGNPLIYPASSAYYTTKYESEAYANEENMSYCNNYDGSNLQKYTFKDRKKIYKIVGGTSKDWKAYVKTL